MVTIKKFFFDFASIVQRVTFTGLAVAIFLWVIGMTPQQFFTSLIEHPPEYITNPWFKISLIVLGLVVISVCITRDIWSGRTKALNYLSEEISWAIGNLVNRQITITVGPNIDGGQEFNQWETDYNSWCNRILEKLENRFLFSKSDEIHFGRLGFVPQINMTADRRYDWHLSQLSLKLDRLREIIRDKQKEK